MNRQHQRESFNDLHAHHPEPGDVWREMFCWSLVVLEVNDLTVNFCCTKKECVDKCGSAYFTWDLDVVEELTREVFVKYLSYNTIPGFWTDVCKGKHLRAVEKALK